MPEPSTSNSNDGNGQKPAIKLKFKPKEDAESPSQPSAAPPPADASRKGLSIKRPPSGAAPATPAGAAAPATPASPLPPPPPTIPKPSLAAAPTPPAAPAAAGPIPPPNLAGPKPPPGVKLVPTTMPEEAAPSGPKIKLSFTSPKRQDLPPEQSGAAAPKQSASKAKGAPSVGPSTAPAQKQLNPLILIGAFAAIVIILLGGMFVLLLLKPAPEVPLAPAAPAPAAPAATTTAAPVPEKVVLTGSTATTVEAPEIEIPSTPEAFVASLSPTLLNAESGIALVIDDVIFPANTIIEPEMGVRFAGFRDATNEAVFQDAKGNTLTRKF